MADQITKILIRKGSNEEKNAIVLDQAELGYTTDFDRVFVGNGVTSGGNAVGQKYFGEKDLDTEVKSLSQAEYGDFVFDTSDSTLCVLSGGTNTDKSNYVRASNINKGTLTRIDVGDGLIINTADTFVTVNGTINLNLDRSTLNPLKTQSEGLLFDLNVLYPVGAVIWTNTAINPGDTNGILEGGDRTWIAAGEVTTSSGAVLYAWIRNG